MISLKRVLALALALGATLPHSAVAQAIQTPEKQGSDNAAADRYRVAQDKKAERLRDAGRKAISGVCRDCSVDRRPRSVYVPPRTAEGESVELE